MRTFASRQQAGEQLGHYMRESVTTHHALVLAFPRGGVIVGNEVAAQLATQLDVAVTKVIDETPQQEVAIAAAGHEPAIVGMYGATAHVPYVTVLDVELHGVESVETVRHRTHAIADVQRRMRGYRRSQAPEQLAGRDIVIISDGLATALPAIAAIRYVRQRGATRAIVAAPVCAQSVMASITALADDVITLASPAMLMSVQRHYLDGHVVSDDEVMYALEAAARRVRATP